MNVQKQSSDKFFDSHKNSYQFQNNSSPNKGIKHITEPFKIKKQTSYINSPSVIEKLTIKENIKVIVKENEDKQVTKKENFWDEKSIYKSVSIIENKQDKEKRVYNNKKINNNIVKIVKYKKLSENFNESYSERQNKLIYNNSMVNLRLYERSNDRYKARIDYLNKSQDEKIKNEMKVCTFNPKINKTLPKWMNSTADQKVIYEFDFDEKIYDRQIKWKGRNYVKSAGKRLLIEDDIGIFKPVLNENNLKEVFNSKNSIIDISTKNYLQRVKNARDENIEKKMMSDRLFKKVKIVRNNMKVGISIITILFLFIYYFIENQIN